MTIKLSISIFVSAIALLCKPCPSKSQENPYSQENAEKIALQKYEEKHPPRPSMPMPSPGENEALFGAHLIRSASLLENSTKARRLPVHILIYGQSIVGSKVFTDDVGNYLKEKFPYADITLENRAIGGFGAEQIIRTSVHDLYPAYPDLIIFHVYGGEKKGELEQLFSNVRRYTTSDILLMSHHLNATQTKTDQVSAKYLRYLANKYDCELADISAEWPKYLAENNLKAADLLRDGVHPNQNGNWVLTQLVCRHIRYNSLFPSTWYKTVRSYYAVTAFDKGTANSITLTGDWKVNMGTAVSNSKESTLKIKFIGNRIDVIAGHPEKLLKTGTARLLLDGKAVQSNNIQYTITRPSPGVGTWWPAIRQISHIKPLIEEDWTLKVEEINDADSTLFKYSVKGSKTGNDGIGNNKEMFISRSGRVVIQPEDVMFTSIKKTFKTATPKGFEVKWSVVPLFKGTYTAPQNMDKTKVYKTTLLQGISNDEHILEIIPNGDGPISIESLEVYEPELK